MDHNEKVDQALIDLIEVKSDIRRVDALMVKLDHAIDKLTEVSSSVGQILAVQTQRLETIEKNSDSNSRRLDQVEKELYNDLTDNRDELMLQIKELQTDIDKRLGKLEEKLSFLERFMWWVSGAAAVAGAIASKLYEKIF